MSLSCLMLLLVQHLFYFTYILLLIYIFLIITIFYYCSIYYYFILLRSKHLFDTYLPYSSPIRQDAQFSPPISRGNFHYFGSKKAIRRYSIHYKSHDRILYHRQCCKGSSKSTQCTNRPYLGGLVGFWIDGAMILSSRGKRQGTSLPEMDVLYQVGSLRKSCINLEQLVEVG